MAGPQQMVDVDERGLGERANGVAGTTTTSLPITVSTRTPSEVSLR